jgi:hypothetical protein
MEMRGSVLKDLANEYIELDYARAAQASCQCVVLNVLGATRFP